MHASNLTIGLALLALNGVRADFPGSLHTVEYDSPPISYSDADIGGPVVDFQTRLAKGEIKLDFHPRFGYLPAVLEALDSSGVVAVVGFFKDLDSPADDLHQRSPRGVFQ